MQFFYLSASMLASLVTLVAASPRVGSPFGLITIRSGSRIQNSPLTVDLENYIRVGSTERNFLEGVFTEDGRIQINNGPFLTVENGVFRVTDTGSLWDTDDTDHLLLQGNPSGFEAVPAADGNGYNIKLYTPEGEAPENIPVVFRLFYREDFVTPTQTVLSETSVASMNRTTTSTVTVFVNPTSAPHNGTLTPLNSTISKPQVSTLEQVNGGYQALSGLCAAVVGVAGALLL